MRDILRETPGYQWLVQQERDESFAKGREEEHQLKLAEFRQMVIKTVQLRCPELVPLAEKQIATINSSDRLGDLIIEISLMQGAEQVSQALLAIENKTES